MILFIGVFLFLGMLTACKKNLPTSPDIPAVVDPTVQSIVVISNSNLLHIGASETFTATATMSDGSSKTVTGGVWSGDNSSVATVASGTGLVTIVGSGMVNISVAYQGRQGTKAIRGLPNYQGTWSGSYVVTACNATGDFALVDFCGFFPIGTELPIELNLIQDDDRVEGRFYLGDLGTDTNGPVQADGQLVLAGAIQESTTTIEVAILLQSATPGQITGSLSQVWRMTELSGSAQIDADVQVDRISTAVTILVPSIPRMQNPTLEDLVRALMRR